MPSEKRDRKWLRSHATTHSLFEPLGLQEAIDKLGFVQADPIRSPARAQDLILRHRATGYRAGDLERAYPNLHVEEDILYAYGFVANRVWRLLRPREASDLSPEHAEALDASRLLGEAHPKALEARLGAKRVVNAWGGFSKATTRALEHLHLLGHLRVARRENGIRVYAPARPDGSGLPASERLRGLVMALAEVFAPCPQSSLQKEIARYRWLGDTHASLRQLIAEGELRQETIEGVSYLWPNREFLTEDAPRRVRFLAPFDPVVWDRRRFEHLWGWAYRFEAYTPPSKRLRGYYAMPLLWGSDVIGWANVKFAAGRASFEFGYVESRPRGRAFASELDAEVARMERFLAVGEVG